VRRLGRRQARGEDGSVLAALMVLLAVSAILLTAAAQKWSFILQREREKELIFRGTAIARAIQDFQTAQNRLPTSLEEMTKTRPPLLRQAYADPMTAKYGKDGKLVEGTGEWTHVVLGRRGTPPTRTLGTPPVSGDDTSEDATGDARDDRRGGARTPNIVGFNGVKSKFEEDSIGTYQGSEPGQPYTEWKFMPLSADPLAGNQHVGGTVTVYPPGFGGLRAPGGPPYTAGPALTNVPGGKHRADAGH
jgi:type II secretory pathway pseudopilin PulG